MRTQTASVPPRSRHKNAAKTGGVADKGQKQPNSILNASAGSGGYTRPGGAAK